MATYTYKNIVEWRSGHLGHTKMDNGVDLDFSAPPSLHGMPGVLTPEDAFIQYVFCNMERMLLRAESRPIYDALYKKYLEVWNGLEGYRGENKLGLCGDIFKKKITKKG